MPHPYFGYVYNWAAMPRANRDGFFDPTDYSKVKKGGDVFYIGVFGGSVASNFSLFQHERQRLGKPSVASELKKRRPQLYAGKEIVLLNFAIDGHRQPQQFAVSAFYADKIDLAITIDGYNEIAYVNPPEYPVEFPGLSVLFFSKDPSRNKYVQEIADLLQRQFRAASTFNTSPILRDSYLAGHVWSLYDRYLQDRISRAHFEVHADVDRLNPYSAESVGDDAQQERQADVWEKYSALQEMMLRAQKVPHFHFLQPNQHVVGSKPLSAEEESNFFNRERAPWINRGYNQLFARIEKLKREGVEVIDLTKIFQKTPVTVFKDDCCHLNETGDEIMAQEIADRILSR